MAKYGKWIGGGLGWALGGPIGAILGFVFGSVIDNLRHQSYSFKEKQQTQAGDFAMALIILSAAIMKADRSIKKSELNYIKQFFRQNFGPEMTQEALHALKEVLKQDIPLLSVCTQIRNQMNYYERLQLMHYLFGIAKADGHLSTDELKLLSYIATNINIRKADYESFFAMFTPRKEDPHTAYKILEISPNATDEEVKKAYRTMAKKFHPDRLSHLGEEYQKAAKEKFQEVANAYEKIKTQRGL
jgi:DnaJ like chaperone protein